MMYITQYWFTPPVAGPPTTGTIGFVNMSEVFGQFAAATPGGQANVANRDVTRMKFEMCEGTSVAVNSTTNRPCIWS